MSDEVSRIPQIWRLLGGHTQSRMDVRRRVCVRGAIPMLLWLSHGLHAPPLPCLGPLLSLPRHTPEKFPLPGVDDVSVCL